MCLVHGREDLWRLWWRCWACDGDLWFPFVADDGGMKCERCQTPFGMECVVEWRKES